MEYMILKELSPKGNNNQSYHYNNFMFIIKMVCYAITTAVLEYVIQRKTHMHVERDKQTRVPSKCF
jgi:hypothetical protein